MTKLNNHKIIIISLIILALGVSGYFIWDNATTLDFKGEEVILNETLATLKEGESINFVKEGEYINDHVYMFFKEKNIAHLKDPEILYRNEKIVYLEPYFYYMTTDKNSFKDNLKKDRYLYEYNLETNKFRKMFKLKNYPITATGIKDHSYYMAYFNSENIKEKKVRDPYLDEVETSSHFLAKKTGSEISNVGTGNTTFIKDRYVYTIVVEEDKVYALVSPKITDKTPLQYVTTNSYNLSDKKNKATDVFIYNRDLKKTGEMKEGKKAFIKKHFKDLDNARDGYIEKNDLGLGFMQEENSDYSDPNAKLGNLIQYKNKEKVKEKSVNFSPSISYFREAIYYSDEKHIILSGTFYKEVPGNFDVTDNYETKLLKVNLETLEWEPFLEPEKPDESLLLKD